MLHQQVEEPVVDQTAALQSVQGLVDEDVPGKAGSHLIDELRTAQLNQNVREFVPREQLGHELSQVAHL